MAITPKMLHAWSRKYDSFLLTWTRDVLTDALAKSNRLEGRDYEIFGQGSFANATNIKNSSDVDLIVELKLPFQEHVGHLSSGGRKIFYELYEPSLYDWHDFQSDVIATLRKRYLVDVSKKCLDIKDWDSLVRVPADVVPALEYREYSAIRSADREMYQSGVFFHDSAGNKVISYPRLHWQHGRRKNLRTHGRFKEIVRAAKNARDFVQPPAEKPEVSSYLIECLVFNVPDAIFLRPLPEAFRGALDWLASQDQWADFQCQNKIKKLFGDAFSTDQSGTARRLLDDVRSQLPDDNAA